MSNCGTCPHRGGVALEKECFDDWKDDPEWWADSLIDMVSTVTQLDLEKGELANVEDWRRCAVSLFKQAIRHGQKGKKGT